MAEATRLALRSVGRGTPSQSRGERQEAGMDSAHGRKLMEFVANVSEDLQKEFLALKTAEAEGSFALPLSLMALLSKLEYTLTKAQEVESEVMESLQALLQILDRPFRTFSLFSRIGLKRIIFRNMFQRRFYEPS